MAAAAGGVNFVRFFFYAGNTISPSRKKALVALAYATARDQQLAPKAILIRSDMHDTTTAGGQHVKDPKGWHGTFAFKVGDQVDREFHVASHGYKWQRGLRPQGGNPYPGEGGQYSSRWGRIWEDRLAT